MNIYFVVNFDVSSTVLNNVLQAAVLLSTYYDADVRMMLAADETSLYRDFPRDFWCIPRFEISSTLSFTVTLAKLLVSITGTRSENFLFLCSAVPFCQTYALEKVSIVEISSMASDLATLVCSSLDLIEYGMTDSFHQYDSTQPFWLCSLCYCVYETKIVTCPNCK